MMAHSGADITSRALAIKRGTNHARGPSHGTLRFALWIAMQVTGVGQDAILGPGRTRRVCHARFLVVLAFRQWGRHGWPYSSLPAIGKALGGRDHTTIMHAVQRATQLIDTDATFAAHWAAFQAEWEATPVAQRWAA